ncbi:MAG: leucine-rich repeat protein [Clostridiales bacterium]|nr:leucine-rich repeat protein [Clostridiales bacterium]
MQQLLLPAALKKINNRAFFNCLALKSLDIPQGVTSIGDDAFGYCYALEKLTLPNGLTSIGTQAFRYCNTLKSLTLPNTVESVGAAAFYNCKSLERLVLSSALTEIKDLTFCHCENLTALDLPASLTFVGQNAFADCNTIKSLTIPSGVTQIDDYAFSLCIAMETLSFAGAPVLKRGAFASCNALKSLTVPNGITEIPQYAFSNCYALSDLVIPNSVTTIGNRAFMGCYALTKLELKNVNHIGEEAFRSCSKLQYVELSASLQSIENNAFSGAKSLFAVCNKSGLDIRAGSDEYGGVAKYAIVVADSADKINLTYVESGKNKFVCANGVWYLYECEIDEDGMGLPESVTTSAGVINSYIIKSHAFGGWVTWVIIPKSVAGLQDNAFDGVSNVYYRGTAQEWDEICGVNSIGSIFFYVDCVHNLGEWTEIDGEISTEVTMTAWTVVKDATCTEKGKLERHCDRCGKDEEHELAIDPDAHEYDENGKCKHCGAIEPDNDDDADTYTDNEDARSRV